MEDRHAREISQSLKSVSSAIYVLALAVYFGLQFASCMIGHH